MRRSQSPIAQSLFSISLVVLLLVSAVSLSLEPSAEQASSGVRIEPAAETIETSAAAADTAASARREGVETFLICGKDRASGLCDVIIVARLDTKNHAVSLVQIPRDTYAAYTERDYRKLNGAASALGGMKALSAFLSSHLGIPIDHYALVDLDSVGDVVDAIGGVTLTIPEDMDYEDDSQGLSIHLKAGKQTLDGDLAEQFVRFRAGYVRADLGRLDAQKLFLGALLDQVRNHTTLPELVRVVKSLYGRVETDLSLGETVRLASVAMKLKPDRLTMATLPGEATRTGESSGAWYYVLERSAAYDTVNEMLNVYEGPLSSARFDPKEIFTSKSHPHFDAIYRGKEKTSSAIDGEEINTYYGSVPRIRE